MRVVHAASSKALKYNFLMAYRDLSGKVPPPATAARPEPRTDRQVVAVAVPGHHEMQLALGSCLGWPATGPRVAARRFITGRDGQAAADI